MKEDLLPFTREQYDRIKANAEALGYGVATKWRKGLKRIQLGEVVLPDDSQHEDAQS